MRIYSCFSKQVLLLLSLLLSSISAHAQSTSSLRGTVTDPSGAVIPDAVVTISSAENGAIRRNSTDANGEYSFLQVLPGTYKLTVEKTGFATMTRGDVKLLVNTPATLNLTMAISATGEVVNVTTEALEVNTTDASCAGESVMP